MRFEVGRRESAEKEILELLVPAHFNGYSAAALAWVISIDSEHSTKYVEEEWTSCDQGWNNTFGHRVYQSYPKVSEAYFPVVMLTRDLTGLYHVFDDMEASEKIGEVRILNE